MIVITKYGEQSAKTLQKVMASITPTKYKINQ
jgi:hypothetical protein